MSGYLLFADDPPPRRAEHALSSVEFWLAIGLLTTVLFAGAFLLLFVDRWKKRQLRPEDDSTESLTSFRAMYERGELSEEEYQRVRDRVAAKMKREVAAANPSMAAPLPDAGAAARPPDPGSRTSGESPAGGDGRPPAAAPES